MGFGAVLVVVGAILKFAVSASTTGLSIPTVGLILLLVGIVLFVAGLAVVLMAGSRRSVTREGIQNVPGGQERVVEQQDRWSAP